MAPPCSSASSSTNASFARVANQPNSYLEENRSSDDTSPPLVQVSVGTDERQNNQRVQDFFLCLTICNTCVVSANKNVQAPVGCNFLPVSNAIVNVWITIVVESCCSVEYSKVVAAMIY